MSAAADKEVLDQTGLGELERGVASRLFRLSEAVMRLAVTPNPPSYDDNVIAEGIEPLIALAEVILASRSRQEGGK